MNKPLPEYPAYALSERIADGTIHAIGTALAIAGAVLLIVAAAGEAPGERIAGVSVYAAAIVFSFAASGFYHMTPWERLRPALRRIDHAAIYFKIAGTYTPLVVMIGSAFAYVVLAVVWALAVVGAVAKLFFWNRPGKFAPILYLALGWASVMLLWPLAQTLPGPATGLVVIGGVLYSAGVIFFSWETLKYANAIWHAFVLAASSCFFAAIAMGTFA